MPIPKCYHAEFGHSALKGVSMNIGEPKKLGNAETALLGWGGVADAKNHAPLPRVLPRQIWQFCDKGCTRNDNNNNNNNNRISIAPYGLDFRGAGGRSDQCSVKV